MFTPYLLLYALFRMAFNTDTSFINSFFYFIFVDTYIRCIRVQTHTRFESFINAVPHCVILLYNTVIPVHIQYSVAVETLEWNCLRRIKKKSKIRKYSTPELCYRRQTNVRTSEHQGLVSSSSPYRCYSRILFSVLVFSIISLNIGN